MTNKLKCLIALPIIGIALAACDPCPNPSRIGDHNVPSGLRCEEDEVIGIVSNDAPPADVACIHIDDI
jgi:hypothetical protein